MYQTFLVVDAGGVVFAAATGLEDVVEALTAAGGFVAAGVVFGFVDLEEAVVAEEALCEE